MFVTFLKQRSLSSEPLMASDTFRISVKLTVSFSGFALEIRREKEREGEQAFMTDTEVHFYKGLSFKPTIRQ